MDFIPDNLEPNINGNDIPEESIDRIIHNDPTPPTPPTVATPKNTQIENLPIKLSNQMSKFDVIPVIEEREEMV